MKKMLMIVLIAFVQFQFSWAVAGAYCQHESKVTMSHFGHHAHLHQSQTDQHKSSTPEKIGKIHSDCHSCHSIGFPLFFKPESALAFHAAGKRLNPPPSDNYTSHIADGPHKPDRFRFV